MPFIGLFLWRSNEGRRLCAHNTFCNNTFGCQPGRGVELLERIGDDVCDPRLIPCGCILDRPRKGKIQDEGMGPEDSHGHGGRINSCVAALTQSAITLLWARLRRMGECNKSILSRSGIVVGGTRSTWRTRTPYSYSRVANGPHDTIGFNAFSPSATAVSHRRVSAQTNVKASGTR